MLVPSTEPHDFEAGNAGCILGRAALIVIEIGGDRNYRLLNRLAEKGLCITFDLLQKETRQFFGRKLAIAQAHLFATAHQPFEGRGSAFRIHGHLSAGWLTDQHLSICSQCNVAWKCLAAEGDAFGAGNDNRASAA